MKNDIEKIFNEKLFNILNKFEGKNFQKFSKEYIDKETGEIFSTVFNELEFSEVIVIINYSLFPNNEVKEKAKIHFLNFILSESYFFTQFFNEYISQMKKHFENNDLEFLSVYQSGWNKSQKLLLNFNLTFSNYLRNENSFLYELHFVDNRENKLLFISNLDFSQEKKTGKEFQYIEKSLDIDLKYNYFFDYLSNFYCEGNLENSLIDSKSKRVYLQVEMF